jgi:hypothetical protein
VKTHWISMLNLLKCLLARYKSLVVKMHSNCVKSIYDHDNFELLCDLDLILGLPCVMPILEVVHWICPTLGCVYHGLFRCDKSY